jgi:hypothetical protein
MQHAGVRFKPANTVGIPIKREQKGMSNLSSKLPHQAAETRGCTDTQKYL